MLHDREISIVCPGSFADAIMKRRLEANWTERERWFAFKNFWLAAFVINDSVIVWLDSIFCTSQIVISANRAAYVSIS